MIGNWVGMYASCKEEAQMRRLSFFGRPAQKSRLVMRERQVRNI